MRLLLLLLASLPAFAAGSVQQTCQRIGFSQYWVVAFHWTGDVSTGSVPDTPAACSQEIQGARFISVESAPGSPTPTNGFVVKIKTFLGADILGATGGSSSTVPLSFTPAINAPPVYGAFVLSISGQGVASARGTVYVYLLAK